MYQVVSSKYFYKLALFTLFFTLLSTVYLLHTEFAYAVSYPIHQTIRVTPIVLTPTLLPGKSWHETITVENLLDQPMGISLSLEALDASDEDNGITFTNLPGKTPLLSWLTLSETQAILKPHEKRTFDLLISVPAKIQSGQENAVLFVTPFVSRPKDTALPSVVSKIGTLILATIGTPNLKEAKEKTKILTFTFGSLVEKAPPKLTLRVKNTYGRLISVKPFVTIYPLFGKKETTQLPDKRILSDKIRRWKGDFALTQTNHIFYKAVANVSVGGGETITKTTYFVLFPVIGIIRIVFWIMLLSSLYMGRQRVKKALHILMYGSLQKQREKTKRKSHK